ncbi:MAG: polysaccharide deacetylase family protein [Akkermansia sp.]
MTKEEMMDFLFNRLANKALKSFCLCRVRSEREKRVYLTFDDGPEPGITEFVLQQLRLRNFRATFFCCGERAEKYPELMEQIRAGGHVVANHSYSHIHSFRVETATYVQDVERAARCMQTNLFRPPWGSLTWGAWRALRTKQRMVMWSLGSDDSAATEDFDATRALRNLIGGTAKGDVVLFHFSLQHAPNTQAVLPGYLEWLSENGWTSGVLTPELR